VHFRARRAEPLHNRGVNDASFERLASTTVFICSLAAACASGGAAPAAPSPEPQPRACTEIGCIDGLRVSLTPTDRWPAGNYVFQIDTDAGSATCRGSLPLPPCGTAGLQCTGVPVQIGESGCALPPDAHGFSDMTFSSAPKRLKVRITRDEQPLVEREIQPVYQRVQPNGEGCAPICTTAGESLRVF
jgi:hypothetical protein